MSIKLLSEKAINRIAAGEVVERPISVVKELIENAIDAEATEIDIRFVRGGRTLISVTDNGSGIIKDELKLALQRHATSKIQEEDLNKIEFFGFRGEALPSIAAVGLMTVISRVANNEVAWQVQSINKDSLELSIAKHNVGTTVELRDIFCFTPNRIKFLKSESAENSACIDLIKRFALCFPKIKFQLSIDSKVALSSAAQAENMHIDNLLGQDFKENTINFHYRNAEINLNGYIGLPTFNHNTSLKQYYFVNNRVVKDKLLATAVKIAYADLIPHGRYPALILFLKCPDNYVDVNVHPSKSEVRFADEQLIKKAIIEAIRSNINSNRGQQSTNIFSNQVVKIIDRNQNIGSDKYFVKRDRGEDVLGEKQRIMNFKSLEKEAMVSNFKSHSRFEVENHLKEKINKEETVENDNNFLGYAISQIDDTYIVSLTSDNEVIITDQHAAHERVVLEEMKIQVLKNNIKIQHILIPEILSYENSLIELLIAKKDKLENFGITIERNGINQILVMTMPTLMQNFNLKDLFDIIVRDLIEQNDIADINLYLDHIYSNIACKNSIKAKRRLSIEEMNALLRKMENTPFIEQCNHGRPTYIKITSKDLNKFFERN